MRWLVTGVLVMVGCGSTAALPEGAREAPGPGGDGGARDDDGAAVVPGDGDAGTSADGGATDDGGANDAGTGAWTLPPANAPFDYQLGGAYAPPAGVKVVVRDRTAQPATGLYNICYVNGFQVQPSENTFWLTNEPDLVLRDKNGNPVIDEDWDEMMIDVGTPQKRARVAAIVGGWIKGCGAAGYDAVEIDNLDSFSRSNGLLKESDAVAAMALFSATAHDSGLAIAQKNSAELVGRRAEMGTDFVVAEECNRYGECGTFTGAYGDQVFVVEYRRPDFDAGCKAFPQLSIVLRDLNLVTPGKSGYVHDGC